MAGVVVKKVMMERSTLLPVGSWERALPGLTLGRSGEVISETVETDGLPSLPELGAEAGVLLLSGGKELAIFCLMMVVAEDALGKAVVLLLLLLLLPGLSGDLRDGSGLLGHWHVPAGAAPPAPCWLECRRWLLVILGHYRPLLILKKFVGVKRSGAGERLAIVILTPLVAGLAVGAEVK